MRWQSLFAWLRYRPSEEAEPFVLRENTADDIARAITDADSSRVQAMADDMKAGEKEKDSLACGGGEQTTEDDGRDGQTTEDDGRDGQTMKEGRSRGAGKEQSAQGTSHDAEDDILRMKQADFSLREDELAPVMLAYRHGFTQAEDVAVSRSLEENANALERLYHADRTDDLKLRFFTLKSTMKKGLLLAYIDGMVDAKLACPVTAPLDFSFGMKMSVPSFWLSATTNPKFLLFVYVPTTTSLPLSKIETTLPSLLFPVFNSVISTCTLSPFIAPLVAFSGIKISSFSPSMITNPNPLAVPEKVPGVCLFRFQSPYEGSFQP